MKFKIKYADQIVGILTIFAIIALIVVIFMLGSKQRWFAKNYDYNTTFETGAGLSPGMPLQYKGFTIGKIKKISLDENNLVSVSFYIFDNYNDRAKEGSCVELIINPIGLGNQFMFYPGNGSALIAENSSIPRIDSPEGRMMVENQMVSVPKREDTISNIVAQVNPLLTNINNTLSQINGTGKGPLADTMMNVNGITGNMNASLGDILTNVNNLTAELSKASSSPDGLVPALMDPDGTMFDNIETSLNAVAGTLNNVEDASSILKTQVPQIARMIEDLRIALVKGQDVLEALRNNPILKNGVPDRVQSDSSGTNSRNIDF